MEQRHEVRRAVRADGGEPAAIGARDELPRLGFGELTVLSSQLRRAHPAIKTE